MLLESSICFFPCCRVGEIQGPLAKPIDVSIGVVVYVFLNLIFVCFLPLLRRDPGLCLFVVFIMPRSFQRSLHGHHRACHCSQGRVEALQNVRKRFVFIRYIMRSKSLGLSSIMRSKSLGSSDVLWFYAAIFVNLVRSLWQYAGN